MSKKECTGCSACATEEKEQTTVTYVPYYVYEAAAARAEEKNRRLIILLAIAILLSFATNIAWLYYESQFETVTYTQDGDGINKIIISKQEESRHGTEIAYQNEKERKREGRESQSDEE